MGPAQRSQYRDALWTGQLGVRNPVGQEVSLFSTSIHTAPATNPFVRKMGTCALSWGKANGAWRWTPKAT